MNPLSSEQSRWFVEKVQPHEVALRSYLRAMFPSLPDVDDLVQEAYARLIRAKHTGRIEYVKAFLFATARNAALDIFRRKKIAPMESLDELCGLSVFVETPDAAEAACKQQELDLLAEAVRRLPDRCRQVLTLRLLYALPQKAIAERLAISEHTVKAQLAKGMRRCAQFLEQQGLARGAHHAGNTV